MPTTCKNTGEDINLEQYPPEEVEKVWVERVYRGDLPQLTLRAVLMGAFLGGFMALSNLYIGLKTGWGLGVAITACVMSYTISKALTAIGFFKDELSILENNCMQSTATSAGYSTGGTMVSAISAYLIITQEHIGWFVLGLWTVFIALLGIFIAVPLKRQMINREQLKFPSGTAAAETLRGLHGQDSHEAGDLDEGSSKGLVLTCSALLSAVLALFRDYFSWIKSFVPLPFKWAGQSLDKWTIGLEVGFVMPAAGIMIGWRMAWSMLLGAVILYGYLAPEALSWGAIDSELGYRAIVSWSTWPGASIMVAGGLISFAFQIPSLMASFQRSEKIQDEERNGEATGDYQKVLAEIEVPGSWFWSGTIFSAIGCIAILYFAFDTSWWMGVIAVLASVLLSIVACRATGESDITPVGAMGKITQLTFGFLAPSKMITNLMTASLTANVAGAAADLLTDLKSGYLLGANPRKQFLAQLAGVFTGTLVVVPAFYLLVPTADVLGTDQWPAPAAQVWASVAKLLGNGLSSLHPTAQKGLLLGLLVGAILAILENVTSDRWKSFVPSATGVGIAFVIPFFNSLSMFFGALLALFAEHFFERWSKEYLITIAAGLIAGESLMGVFVALLQTVYG